MGFPPVAVVVLIVAGAVVATEEPAKVTLGGPRRVEARISTVGDDYRIEVRMLPVQAFDAAINDRLNREKARTYGLQALARFLSGKDAAEIVVSGVRVIEVGTEKPFFTATLVVPRGKVALVAVGQPPAQPAAGTAEKSERVLFASALFTRKHDLERTLDQLVELLLAELRQVEQNDETFDESIAELEEKADKAFDAFRKEVQQEKLLLRIEVQGLLTRTDKQQERLLESLKAAVARREAKSSREGVKVPPAIENKFQSVEMVKPFDKYLFSNPLLMEVTGAKIIRLPNGDRVILAVASTDLKDDSAKERLRAELVCRVKALASVVAEDQGVQVFRLERLQETTVVESEGKKETEKSVWELLQVTKAKVEGMTRDMPVVGKWRSKEGNIFYLALGMVFDKWGEPIRNKP